MKKTATKKKSTPVTSTISQIKAKNRIDLPMLIILLMIIALGLVMVLSASSPTGASEGDTYKYFKTQTIAAIIGMVLMLSFLISIMIYSKEFINWYIWFDYYIICCFNTKNRSRIKWCEKMD